MTDEGREELIEFTQRLFQRTRDTGINAFFDVARELVADDEEMAVVCVEYIALRRQAAGTADHYAPPWAEPLAPPRNPA